jgi:hypothetical protein
LFTPELADWLLNHLYSDDDDENGDGDDIDDDDDVMI